ncbi:MAG: hypothetical protein J6X31_10405 [Bacteroidales bacterium]|nr:hypothetical protein [Bacteroidales bacterium]MBP5681441.1 hypothetical protein [Bacteroidales bacterium]
MKISNIILWVLMVASVAVLVLFLTAEKESLQLTTGQFTDVSTQLDTFLYWMEATVGLGLIILPVSIAIDAIMGKRWSLLVVIASVVILYYIFYFTSGAEGFSRIVNGETQVFETSTMKMIDGWIYSIYALVGVTVLLIAGFGIKRLIFK